MHPLVSTEEGIDLAMSHSDRQRLLISTLMHEFGHALEQHFKLPDNESAIESACISWDESYETRQS